MNQDQELKEEDFWNGKKENEEECKVLNMKTITV
jgi:hypothetical protein